MQIVATALPLSVGAKAQTYSAHLEDGRLLVASCRDPLTAGARALIEDGVDPRTPLTLRHAGSEMVCLRSTVGKAAGLTVIESERQGPKLGRYQPMTARAPFLSRASGTGTASDGREVVRVLPDETAVFTHPRTEETWTPFE